MKKVKYLILLVLTILLFACSKKILKSEIKNYDYSVENEDTIVINAVNFDYQIEVKSQNDKFNIIDEDGNFIEYEVENNSDVKIVKAKKNKWDSGKTYIFSLDDKQEFNNDDFKKYKRIKFTIVREKTEKIIYKNNVINLLDGSFNGLDNLQEFEKKVGNIVLYKDSNNNCNAIKISNISLDGSVETEIAKLDEVIENIDVYGLYNLDFDAIEKDENIEIALANNIKKSKFFELLLMTVYADDLTYKDAIKNTDIKVSFKKVSNDDLKITINFIFNPKISNSDLNSNVNHHKFSIIFDAIISPKVLIDFKSIDNMKAEFKLANKNDLKFNVTYLNEKSNNDDNVVNKLLLEMEDLKEEIHLLSIPIRIPTLPIIMAKADLNFVPKLNLSVDTSYEHKNDEKTISYIEFKNNEFKTSSSHIVESISDSLIFDGKANITCGIGTDLKICIVNENVCYLSLKPEGGIYTELKGKIDLIKKFNDQLKFSNEVSLEFGTYTKVDAIAYINLVKKDFVLSKNILDKKNTTFKYSSNGNSKKHEYKDSKTGEILAYYEYITNSDTGRVSSLILYDKENNVIDKIDYENDEVGMVLLGGSFSHSSKDSTKFWLTRKKYEYDGNNYKEYCYRTLDNYNANKYDSISYYENRVRIYEEAYNDDGSKEVSYYVKDGVEYVNPYLIIIYDSDGNEISKIEKDVNELKVKENKK